MKRLIIVFKERKFFEETRRLAEKFKDSFPTTSFNEKRLSMTIEKGEIKDAFAIGIGCLQLIDSDRTEFTLDVAKIRSLNRTSPYLFQPRR